MQNYFAPPPYYYKQFQSPNTYDPPNLSKIQKQADDFISFGELHQVIYPQQNQFTDYQTDEMTKAYEDLKALNLPPNLKEVLKDKSKALFEKCLQILKEAENNQMGDTSSLIKNELDQITKICQFIYLKDSYSKLETIYTKELETLKQVNEELSIETNQLQEKLDFL